jgi:hypothetical protein
MTTDEEKTRGKGSAVRAVFAGATIGAVFGGWFGYSTYVPPEGNLDFTGPLRDLLEGAIFFSGIGGFIGFGLWRFWGWILQRMDAS